MKTETELSDLSPKESFIKNWRNVDFFLNLANIAQHVILTLGPPSGYTLNLKALIKVSNVSWTSQLSYVILIWKKIQKRQTLLKDWKTLPKLDHKIWPMRIKIKVKLIFSTPFLTSIFNQTFFFSSTKICKNEYSTIFHCVIWLCLLM